MPLPLVRIILPMLLLISTSVVSGQLEDGFLAYQHGDREYAKKNLLPLAIKGDVRAQFFLSVLFDSGTSPEDKENAKRWLTASANNGFVPARFNLGNNYHNGKYGGVNNKMAEYWWNQAAVQGFPEAQYHLATLYYWGKSGVEPNKKEAFYWFERASQHGYQAAAEALLLMRAGEPMPSPDKNTPANIAYDDHRIISKLKLEAKQISSATAPVDVSGPGVSSSTPGSEPKDMAARRKDTVPVARQPEPIDTNSRVEAPEYPEKGWVLQQPGANYTIQLYASTNPNECEELVQRLYRDHLIETHTQSFTKSSQEHCAVIYGSYAKYSQAKSQLSRLPLNLRQAKPWIRKLAR